MPNKTEQKIEQQLHALRQLASTESSEALLTGVLSALTHKHYRLVASAAKMCEEHLLYAAEQALLMAFNRLTENAAKKDPKCIAKSAIIRALTVIDCADIPFYLRCLHYQQLEPTWGGSADSALDIRGAAAVGLANTSYPRAAMELAPLLNDPEFPVRRQVIQAVAVLKPEQAEPLLRLKAAMGDTEAEITSDVLSALIQIAPEACAEFVANFTQSDDPEIQQGALFALGDSTSEVTLQILIDKFENECILLDQRLPLVRSIALHRHEKGLTWLLTQTREGSVALATTIIEALAEFRHDQKVYSLISQTLDKRNNETLRTVLATRW